MQEIYSGDIIKAVVVYARQTRSSGNEMTRNAGQGESGVEQWGASGRVAPLGFSVAGIGSWDGSVREKQRRTVKCVYKANPQLTNHKYNLRSLLIMKNLI